MHDAFLNRSMRLTLIGTISAIALTGLILGYHGVFELICLNVATGVHQLAWGMSASAAALLLIRYRGDLIDD
jgi:hypothetical protein